MKDNFTHITLLCDRTGSMQMIRSDAEGAVNKFIDDQARDDSGPCNLLLIDFDDVDPQHVVFDGVIQMADNYVLSPRGNTPLNDALGKAIVLTGERLAAMDEDARPEHVIFVVQTDGQENASKEYTTERVIEMVKEQTEKWKWTFVFLGTGPDAWAAGNSYQGTQLVTNSTRSAATGRSYAGASAYMSEQVSNLRSGAAADFAVDVDALGNVTKRDKDKEDEDATKS